MRRRGFRAFPGIALFVALLALAPPSLAFAQGPAQTRTGFWSTVGLGWGTADCELCADERVGDAAGVRVGGAAGVLALGGTLSERFLLGASVNAWRRHDGDVTQTLGALSAIVRFYPSSRRHVHFLVGLGASARDVKTKTAGRAGSGTEYGTAAILGAGYDLRIARNVSVTPFANVIGVDFHGRGTGFTQVGLGITVH
jgi:hypothetical protein